MSDTDIELRAESTSNYASLPKRSGDRQHSQDDETLRKLGKRPLLHRNFGFMSILGLSCTVMLSWEGILVTSVPSLLIGGPASVIWAFVINWVGFTSVYGVMAELASIAPTAGGQYHWVAMLAPQSCHKFLTYLTAWLSTLAWQANAVTASYLIATTLQGMVVLTRPNYIPLPWHTMLLIWANAVFAFVTNSTAGRLLARFEGLILIFHLVGFIGILVPLVYFSPHNQASDVFTVLYNNGGWPKQGLAFLVSLPSVGSSLIGADCAVHMSEEIQSAATAVPQALFYTIFINGSLAFAMIVALLFCITDLSAAEAAASTMFYPFLQIFQSGVKSTAGACVMASIILILAIAGGIGVYATTSRMVWSFARDRGLPFDKHLAKLSKSSSLPVHAIFLTMFVTVVLSLIVLGSSVALAALLSLVVGALYTSYLLVCVLTLWRRATGYFQPFTSAGSDDQTEGLHWGPWKIPEPFGTINNAFACIYSLFLLFWSFWPQVYMPTPESANWSALVYGSVIIFCIVWYIVRARKYFKGPVKEI